MDLGRKLERRALAWLRQELCDAFEQRQEGVEDPPGHAVEFGCLVCA
jgi:hypothetical protein